MGNKYDDAWDSFDSHDDASKKKENEISPKKEKSDLPIYLGIAAFPVLVASLFLGSVVFLIGLALTVVGVVVAVRSGLAENNSGKAVINRVMSILSVIAVLGILVLGTVTIEAGERGVVVNSPFGGIGETVDEGWHMDPRYVLMDIDVIRINTQTIEYIGQDAAEDTVGGITVLSKDSLTINIDMAVSFHIPATYVDDLRLDYGADWMTTILHQSVRTEPRTVCSNYTALDIISDKRAAVEASIEEALTNKIDKNCDGYIVVDKVSIREFRIPQALQEAVEAKLTAQQAYDRAQIELETKKIEAEKIKTIKDELSEDGYLTLLFIEKLSELDNVEVIIGSDGLATVKVL